MVKGGIALRFGSFSCSKRSNFYEGEKTGNPVTNERLRALAGLGRDSDKHGRFLRLSFVILNF